MFVRTIIRLFVSLLVLACGAIPALGSSCTATLCSGTVSNGADTTDRNTFNTLNNTLTFTNITFNDETGTYNSGLSASNAPPDPAALLGASFLGCLSNQSPCLTSTSLAVGDASAGGNWDGGTDPALIVPAFTNNGSNVFDTITIALPANVYAFGVDLLWLKNGSSGVPYLISVNGGSNLSSDVSLGLPGSTFFGYSSATAITSVTIYMGAENTSLGLDNLELGTTADAQTPEAVTFLMIGSGLLMLRFGRRWLPRVG
jgi:hypothetical protein